MVHAVVIWQLWKKTSAPSWITNGSMWLAWSFASKYSPVIAWCCFGALWTSPLMKLFNSRNVDIALVYRYIKLIQQIKHLLIITYFSILKCLASSAEENISVICFCNCYPEFLLSLRSTRKKAKQWVPCSWLCQELWGTFVAPVPSRVFSKEEIKAMLWLIRVTIVTGSTKE